MPGVVLVPLLYILRIHFVKWIPLSRELGSSILCMMLFGGQMLQSGSGKQISSELTFGIDHIACALIVSTSLPLPGGRICF